MFAIDTETGGLDLYHGARPFFVTIAYDNWDIKFYEWDVDVYTREIIPDPNDIIEIQDRILEVVNNSKLEDDDCNFIIGQNIKFDVAMLSSLPGWYIEWPWEITRDTLIASHILCSNKRHDLTTLAKVYLGEGKIQKYEDDLKKCVTKCRSKAKRKYPDWLTAKEGLKLNGKFIMPSAKKGGKDSKSGDKDKVWKFDTWLPRAIALEENLEFPDPECDHEWDMSSFMCLECLGHKYHTVLQDYGNSDSAITLALWTVLERMLKEQDLWEIFLHQMKLPRIICSMEKRGITENLKLIKEMENEFLEESNRLEKICINIAKGKGYSISLPKGGRNDNLNDFVFNGLGLKTTKLTKKSKKPSMDKHVLDSWQNTLPPNSKEKLFIDCLVEKRARDTSLTFIKSYQKFGIRLEGEGNEDFAVLHPFSNITGTNTTRFSSQNPNSTQISKLKKTNLRKGMCPAPGRFFVSMDAQNIELRIPAYEANEVDMIYVFDRPKDAPYYGSYHLLIFDLLHPELFKKYGKEVKTLYEDTWYQWCKNGTFARQYGAQKKKVDETYRVSGAYDLIRYRFPKLAKLNDDMIRYANKYGYVETIPNKIVNPRRGYPLWCSMTDNNFVLPTVPLSYHVQGTAGTWMKDAMIKSDEYLSSIPDHYMILTVHDELVFDMPRGNNPEKPWEDSLEIIDTLTKLMESCGDAIGIKTPVTREVHLDSWAVGISI